MSILLNNYLNPPERKPRKDDDRPRPKPVRPTVSAPIIHGLFCNYLAASRSTPQTLTAALSLNPITLEGETLTATLSEVHAEQAEPLKQAFKSFSSGSKIILALIT